MQSPIKEDHQEVLIKTQGDDQNGEYGKLGHETHGSFTPKNNLKSQDQGHRISGTNAVAAAAAVTVLES